MKIVLCFLLGGLFFITGYSQQTPSGLIAHFTFNNTATDLSGNNNNGQIQGNIFPEADRFGNPCGAYRFFGNGSYIVVPNSTTLQAPENSITITLWVKPEKRGEGGVDMNLPLLAKKDTGSGTETQPQYAFHLHRHFGDSYSTIRMESNFSFEDKQYNNHPIEFGRWYFIALTFDESFVTLYLNGKVIAMSPKAESFIVNKQPLVIGSGADSKSYFNGCLDDLRIYSRGLSFSEIDKLYNDSTANQHRGEINYNFPANITKNAVKGTCAAKVFFVEPTINTGCNTEVLKQISGLPSGSDFEVGTTNLVYETKIAGTLLRDSFQILIKDTEPPVFGGAKDIHWSAPSGNEKVSVVYPELSVTDNCPNLKVELQEGLVSGDSFPIGLTKVTYKATDASGNISRCSFNVSVTGTHAPEVKNEIVAKAETEPVKPLSNTQTAIAKTESIGKPAPVAESSQPLPPAAAVTAAKPDYHDKPLPAKTETKTKDTGKQHFVCPADTLILLPPNRKGLVYHYHDISAQKYMGIDSIVKLAGPIDGCFLELGVHPFIYKTFYPSGNTQNCTYSIIIKHDEQAKPYAPPVQLQADLHIGTDSVRYEHKAQLNSCELTVAIYDDGEQDNDTVSIIFNGVVIFNRDMIKVKENGFFTKRLILAPDAENYIIAKAWNTGRYGLNTLRIDVFEGNAPLSLQDLKKRKPLTSKILHSKPGIASGLLLQCN